MPQTVWNQDCVASTFLVKSAGEMAPMNWADAPGSAVRH